MELKCPPATSARNITALIAQTKMAVHTLTTATPVKGDIAKSVAQQELDAVVA